MLALPACDSNDEEEADNSEDEEQSQFEGNWAATFETSEATMNVEMSLAVIGNSISGTATSEAAGSIIPYDIDGIYDAAEVELVFRTLNRGLDFRFDGQISADGERLTGTVETAEGLEVNGVVFTRQ